MKDIRKKLAYNISTCINFETKEALFKMAREENTTVAKLVRKFIVKGVNENER